jgi:hypothetical protein
MFLAIFTAPAAVQEGNPERLYWHHFVGLAQTGQTTNGSKFKEILALPATKSLREHVLQRAAAAPRQWWRHQLPADATDQAALFRPLLDDLLDAESHLELRGPTNRTETLLALKLNDDRARLWSTNLWQIAAAWKLGRPAAVKLDGAAGWELKKTAAPNLAQVVRTGTWTLVGLGHDRLTLLPAAVQQIGKSGRPGPALGQQWLALEADCPRLAGWSPLLATLPAPRLSLQVSPKDENLRTEARLFLEKPLNWQFEPWRIPTNQIREPLVSFTVAQGITPLLARWKTMTDLGLKPLPNQVCLWGQANLHVQTCLAFTAPDVTNTIQQLALRVPPLFRSYLPETMSEFIWISNRAEVALRRMPFLAPTLRPVRENGVDYVFGSCFPIVPKAAPAPPDLFAQLAARRDLLYYDWELTAERLPQSVRAWQIIDIMAKRQVPPEKAPTTQWIVAAGKLLGNAITEIARTGPQELSLTRSAHLGLTGFELATLMRWIESPGFPVTFDPPPSQRRGRTNSPPARPDAGRSSATNRPAPQR